MSIHIKHRVGLKENGMMLNNHKKIFVFLNLSLVFALFTLKFLAKFLF